MIAGPALGGLLIASAGLTATYVVDFASYAFSLACFCVHPPGAPAGRGREPEPRAHPRRLPLREEPAGADRHLRRRLRGHGLRHAAGALSGALGAPGRASGPGPALRGARGGRAPGQRDRPVDAAGPPPRPGRDARGHGVGPGHRRLRLLRHPGPRPRLPGPRRRRRRDQRHLPHDPLERDHPRRPARAPGRHRDGELHERAAPGPRRGGSRRRPSSASGPRWCRAGRCAWWACWPAASLLPRFLGYDARRFQQSANANSSTDTPLA